MSSARVLRGLIDDIGDGLDLFETQGFPAVRIAFSHFRNSGNVEGVSELEQHALKTTIGKMKTEGRPTRAPILTVVDRPIRIGFQMEKGFLTNKFVPRVRPAQEKLRQAGRIELIDRDFQLTRDWSFSRLAATRQDRR